MNYKILINESGVPVLIKMPIETESYDMTHFHKSVIKRYFQALKAAMKPENQIHFKDPIGIMDSLLRNGIIEDVTPSIVGQTFDLPDNLGVSFESCKMCEGTGQYEKPYQQFIKCNYCSNGKLAILTPITEAPVKSEGEDGEKPEVVPSCEEQRMYTRDEVLKIVGNCSNYFFQQGMKEGRPYSNGGDNDYRKWFEEKVLTKG